MAFVLSRTSSHGDNHLHIDDHETQLSSSPVDHQHQEDDHHNHYTDMGRVKPTKSRVEIHLDQQNVYLKGVGVDVEPTRISGYVAVYLAESTDIKEITLNFKGKATLPVPPFETTMNNAPVLTYVVCKHDWSFLEGDKHRSHTLKAGRHIFPFQLRIGGSLPSSIATPVFGGANIEYRLRAHVVRAGFSFGHHNLHATQLVPLVRSFAPEAMEYQHTLEIENTWPEKIMYSILLPHKAWASGDKITALVKCSPLVKGLCVLSVQTTIQEQTKVYARSGSQETTRVIASVRHEIVNGKPVEVAESRPSQFQPYSVPGSPGTPGTPSGSAPPSRPASIHLPMNPAAFTASTSSSASSTTASTSGRDSTHQPDTQSSRNSSEADLSVPGTEVDPESADLVTFLSINVPLNLTPSHTLEPIIVSHRVRWSILLLNPDGHTSELRCSLPIHLLDYRLLAESRLYSAPTRRLILGLNEVPEEEEEDVQLPSYQAHVRDRVANMYLPETATMRVTNPWIAQGVSPTIPGTPDSATASAIHSAPAAPLQFWPSSRSGRSTPLEAHLLGHLPHQPGSDTSTPLDWVNSELLLSLSKNPPPRLRSPQPEEGSSSSLHQRTTSSESEHHHPLWHMSPTSTRPTSRITSRIQSRAGSRASSPERVRNVDLVPPTLPQAAFSAGHHRPGHHSSADTFLHGNNSSSRHLPSLLNTSMKPLSSFGPHGWVSRTPSMPAVPTLADLDRTSSSQSLASAPGGGIRHVPSPVRRAPKDGTGAELLHRAFTAVPDYEVAARGFIGGVPPLSSMEGLPSYDEAQKMSSRRASRSETDLTSGMEHLAMNDHAVGHEEEQRGRPQSTGPSAPSMLSIHSSVN